MVADELWRVLQRTYQSAWRLETLGSASWRREAGRRLLWAGGLVVYVGATFGLADVSAHGLLAIARDGARVTLALAFFSWGPYVLLGRQVAPRRLLPTAILGAVALGTVTAVAPLYLPGVASASASSYGLVGFAFAFATWLFVQALLIVGSAVAGAVIGERVGGRDPAWWSCDGSRGAPALGAGTWLHLCGTWRTTRRGHPGVQIRTDEPAAATAGSNTMTLTTPRTDRPRAVGSRRRLRSLVIRPFLLLVVVLVPALGLAACGQSAADKATSQVCSARAGINKQIDYLKGLTLTTGTTTGIKNSLNTISDDLTKIKDAQPQLNAERKQQVQSASQTFRTQLESVVTNVGTNLSISNAEAHLKTAVQQLARSYQQTFAAINCS